MDCHEKNTHFKLLGLFKEPSFGDWMEQLFKHLGVCVWTEDEYEFMQQDREEWPEECSQTGIADENGNYLYYDTKPQSKGRISIGLYTDATCVQDYSGKKKVENVLHSMYYGDNDDGNADDDGGSMLFAEENTSAFNDALEAFKYCQPCVTYNLNYNGDGDNDGDGDGLFDCNDDAGYTNVNQVSLGLSNVDMFNFLLVVAFFLCFSHIFGCPAPTASLTVLQCMKFRTQTEMYTADFHDIALASEQGSIVDASVIGKSYGTPPSLAGNLFLVFSILVLCLGVFLFCKAKKRARASSSLDTPLVSKSGDVATLP